MAAGTPLVLRAAEAKTTTRHRHAHALGDTSEKPAILGLLHRAPNAVVFLASSRASYISGAVLAMDGALTPIVV